MHPWCRSSTAPVLDYVVLREHKRWARDPATGKEMSVPGDMTYQEWRQKQIELHGKEAWEQGVKRAQNQKRDKAQMKAYQERLGKHFSVSSVAEWQKIKYNDPEQYAALQRSYRTVGELDRKEWNDPFKERAKKAYWSLHDDGIEAGSHAISRILTNKRDVTVQDVKELFQKPANYMQEDGRNVRYYDGKAVVTDEQDTIVTVLFRKKGDKEDWIKK